MEMTFSLGSDIQMDFSVGGAAPVPPEPAPETPHTWTMKCNGITGEIGTYTVPEETPTVSQN